MPALQVLPVLPTTTATGYYDDLGPDPTLTATFYHTHTHSENSFFSEHTTTLVNELNGWSPLPTNDPNRPDSVNTENQPTPTPVPTVAPKSTPNAPELVGVVVSAGVVFIVVLFATVWWMRRNRASQDFGNGSRQKHVIEEGDKPPSYEAAVFGTHRGSQPDLSINTIPHQPPPPSVPQPTLQSPPPIHHIHSPRPISAITTNRTLHRLDLNPEPPQDIPRQPDSIIIYPHDSPPPSPSSPEPSALSIRSSPQISSSLGSDQILSHHITDFTENYPNTTLIDSDSMDEEEVAVKEIV